MKHGGAEQEHSWHISTCNSAKTTRSSLKVACSTHACISVKQKGPGAPSHKMSEFEQKWKSWVVRWTLYLYMCYAYTHQCCILYDRNEHTYLKAISSEQPPTRSATVPLVWHCAVILHWIFLWASKTNKSLVPHSKVIHANVTICEHSQAWTVCTEFGSFNKTSETVRHIWSTWHQNHQNIITLQFTSSHKHTAHPTSYTSKSM